MQLVDKTRKLNKHANTRYVTLAALDIKKAFDCVNHELLIEKLDHKFHLHESSCELIRDYLTNRSQCMKANNHISSELPLTTGVPQGSVLGPLLFIAFINDLMNLENCYLFADDCLLLTSGSSPHNCKVEMENKLNAASQWYKQNQLTLNASKTDVMTISSNKLPDVPDIKFGDLVIKQSDKLKYLGVYLDNRLNMNAHVKRLKQKLYPVITCFSRQRQFLNGELAAKWYTGLIRPVIEYSAPLLYCSNKEVQDNLLKIENRCIKIINTRDSKSSTRGKFQIHYITERLHYLYLLSFYKLTNNLVPLIDNNLIPEKLNSRTRLVRK